MATAVEAIEPTNDERELEGVQETAWLLDAIELDPGEFWFDEDGSRYPCVAGHQVAKQPGAQLTFRWRNWVWSLNVCGWHWQRSGDGLVLRMSLASVRRAVAGGQ